MLKKTIISFLTVLIFLTAGSRGEAFVPQTPHLLYLMGQTIKEPAGLLVLQDRQVPAAVVPSAAPVSGADTVTLKETLTYLFPGKLRSQVAAAAEQYYVVSGAEAVRVDGSGQVAMGLSPADRYTDILLYRDRESLAQKLAESGVNTAKVTFQRLDGRICYFIGQPPYGQDENPGLWIEKDSYFPVRYLLKQGQWTVDIRYDDWQRVSRTWYPMAVRILVNGHLFADIKVDRISLVSTASAALFDVARILAEHPVAEDPAAAGHEDRVKILNKTLEDFSKLYD